MNKYIIVGISLFVLLSSHFITAQGKIGEWTDHLDYKGARSVAIVGNQVFCASSNGLFVFNKQDNSVSKINRINGLSDINIGLLQSNQDREQLIVAYVNGNMDIIQSGIITNFAAIKNSTAIGDKRIRHIFIDGARAYLSTGLGVLEFNLDRFEVSNTFTINDGNPRHVNATVIFQDRFYAATEDGLFYADLTDDLTVGLNWQQQLDIPFPFSEVHHMAVQGNKLFINQKGVSAAGVYFSIGDGNWTYSFGADNVVTIRESPIGLLISLFYYNEVKAEDGVTAILSFTDYNQLEASTQDMAADEEGNIWMADASLGLVKRNVNDGLFEVIAPGGPFGNRVFDLDFKQDRLWVTTGATDRPGTWNNFYIMDGFSTFSDGEWRYYNQKTEPSLSDQVFWDAVKVYAHPKKANFAWVGSYFSGFAEVENGEIARYISDIGTSLQGRVEFVRPDNLEWVGIAGMCLDSDENLWVTNSLVPEPLSVRTPDNVWKSFDLAGPQGLGNNKQLLDLIIDRQGQKWAIVNKAGLIVFDEGESIEDESDDKVRAMNASVGTGGLPSNEVLAIAEDLDGEIWVATRSGMAVFYSPFDALSLTFSDARQILVEQDGVFQFLFEGQEVTSIAIDGANRKWVGTFGNGIFLLSEDGTDEILRFNTTNSPLPSNTITDIAIDPKSGRVYIATAEGLMSYLSDAIQGQNSNICSTVYPNPVRENYTGPISISGLTRDAEVRITDTRGNLIFSTQSNGGRAIWDGRNSNGQRVATGVYFALVADVVGGSECVSKILVIK